jgi:hypothetical protein
MIDFSLKAANQRVGGLNIGLCPGTYIGKESFQNSLYLTETAFNFLEPSIRKHSPGYARAYSHWGVTKIPRAEWGNILLDWDTLRTGIETANTAQEVGNFCSMSNELENEFKNGFETNKTGLLHMIDELNAWLRTKLSSHDQISILGV